MVYLKNRYIKYIHFKKNKIIYKFVYSIILKNLKIYLKLINYFYYYIK